MSSPQDNALRGLGGVYYYSENNRERNRQLAAFAVPFQENGSDFDTNKVDNLAVFGQLEFEASDQLTVAVEARYAEDEIETIGSTGLTASATFTSFSPRVTVDYQVNDNSMLYALVAKGNKPGGFNTLFFGNQISEVSRAAGIAAGQDSIDEEKAWTYEIGTKNTVWDGRATLNISAYYLDWTNQQLTRVIEITDGNGAPTTAPVLVNLGATEIWGGEIEAFVAITEELSFNAGYGMADSEIKILNDADIALITGVDDPDLVNGGNASGNQLPNQPKHTLSVSGTYRDALTSDVDWFFTTDLNIESKRWTEVGNFSHTGDIWHMNMRLGVDAGNWKLTAFMNNALNDLTANNILRFRDYRPEFGEFAFNGQRWRGLYFNQPRGRDFGITAQYSF